MNLKEIWAPPNLLSVVRLLMIPLIAYTYLTAVDYSDYLLSGVLIIISGLTDVLDGILARKYNMVTDLGKILDPFADKMTQMVLAVCVAIRIPQTSVLLIVFIALEVLMIAGGLILIYKGVKIPSAKWFGKLATFTFYAVMTLFVFFPYLDVTIIGLLVGIALLVLIFAFVMYIPDFIRMFSKRDEFIN